MTLSHIVDSGYHELEDYKKEKALKFITQDLVGLNESPEFKDNKRRIADDRSSFSVLEIFGVLGIIGTVIISIACLYFFCWRKKKLESVLFNRISAR